MTRWPFGRARTWGLRGVLGAAIASLVACGGSVAGSQPDASSEDASTRSPPTDASAGADGGSPADADAGGGSGADADAGASCADLEDAAQAGLAAVVQQNLACQGDQDCTSIFLGPSGWCAAPCSVLTNEAGAATVLDAAASLCSQFNAEGCKAPVVPCPAAPPAICAGGTCAVYDFYATQLSPTLTHGACAAFQLNYKSFGGSPNAPHDLRVTMTASNGTLYADTACGTPMGDGGVTIPAGSTSAAFGFEPAAPGLCWIMVQGVVSSWTAQ